MQCGKWPSLFDLQESVEQPAFDELSGADFEVDVFEPETFEPQTMEPQPFEPQTIEPGPVEPGQVEHKPVEPDEEDGRPRWLSILSSLIVPLVLLVYFVIAFLSDR